MGLTQSGIGNLSLVLVAPMNYTLMVYTDPKVQPPLPEKDMTKHPKSHKTSLIDIKATISK